MKRVLLSLSTAAAFALALAYRLRPKPLIDAVRVWNKHVTNPPMMVLAGRRYWYAAVIRHEGRRSGKGYATPVKAVRVEGGFVIPLTYGEGVDWLKNVREAGRATIEKGGTTYAVAEPKVIDAEATLPLLPPRKRLTWRLFGPRRCLRVKLDLAAAHGRAPMTGSLVAAISVGIIMLFVLLRAGANGSIARRRSESIPYLPANVLRKGSERQARPALTIQRRNCHEGETTDHRNHSGHAAGAAEPADVGGLAPLSRERGSRTLRPFPVPTASLRRRRPTLLRKVLYGMAANALLLALLPALAIAQTGAPQPVDPPPQVDQLRQHFEGLTTQQIEALGYVPEGPCVTNPQGIGAMGTHAINQELYQAQFRNGTMDPANPNVLLVSRGGKVIGLEWEAADVGQGPIKMFGQTIELQSGHPGAEEPHYMLHIYFKPDGKVLFGTNDQSAFDPELSCLQMSATVTSSASPSASAAATATATSSTSALAETGGMWLMPVLAVGALGLLLTGGLTAAVLVRRS